MAAAAVAAGAAAARQAMRVRAPLLLGRSKADVLALHKGLVSADGRRAPSMRAAAPVLTWTVNDPALVARLSASASTRSARTTPAWRSLGSPRARNAALTDSYGGVATLIGAREARPFHRLRRARPRRCRHVRGSVRRGAADDADRRASASTTQKPVAKSTPQAAAKPVAEEAVATLPPSVRIAGVRVGHLVPTRAEKVVQRAFNKPLAVQIDKLRLLVDPAKLAKPYVSGAVGHARSAKPGTSLPLVVNVHGVAVRAWAKKLADADRPRAGQERARAPPRQAVHRRRAPSGGSSTRTI